MDTDDQHGEPVDGQPPIEGNDPEESGEDFPDQPAAKPVPAVPPIPVTQPDRIQTLDLLRGIAVLGILLVNTWAFALPFPAALNPRLLGFTTILDRIAYVFVHMVALTKTMPIFSMLFGAGIVLFAQRLEERGRKPAWFFVRRNLWLLVFGLVHAYLLWDGDILVPYAMVGLILYAMRFRHRRPRTLLVFAVLAMLVPKLLSQGGGVFMEMVKEENQAAELALAAGDTLDAKQEKMQEIWQDMEMGPTWNPTADDIDELNEIMRGSYLTILVHSAPETALMHFFFYPLFVGWNIAGFMLLGMMLFKTGVLTGDKPTGFYARMAAVCYGVGLPLALYGLWYFDTHTESFIPIMQFGMPMVGVSGPLVALGHIALIILAWRRGWLDRFQHRLAATGRMAFTNYMAQTVICILIFHGYGLGLFGSLNRLEQLGVVAAIWIVELWWSPLWLRRYRFGPLEWLWRSLTYRSRQPFRQNSD